MIIWNMSILYILYNYIFYNITCIIYYVYVYILYVCINIYTVYVCLSKPEKIMGCDM